ARVNETGRVTGPGLLANAFDPDGDALRVTHVNGQAIGDGAWVDLPQGRLYVRFDGRVGFDDDHDFDGLAAGQTALVGFDYTVDDGRGGTATATATLSVAGNLGPSFVNVPDSGLLIADEGSTFVVDLNAADPEGDVLSYAVTGGADAAKFVVDPDTGALSFVTAPTLGGGSAAGDNQYRVEVTVSDGHGGSETRAIEIDVDDKELLGVNLISNGDFEDNNLLDSGFGTFDETGPWRSVGVAPATIMEHDIGHGQGDGDAIVHLTQSTAISQTVSVTDAGAYRLNFNAFKLGYDFDNDVEVTVDGVSVGVFRPFAEGEEGFSVEFDLDAGAHDIAFRSLGLSSVQSVAIDNVELRQVMTSEAFDPASRTVIQAEDMTLAGYVAQDFVEAEGGWMLRVDKTELNQAENLSGDASFVFGGESGDYVVALRAIDESDGDGFIQLLVNDRVVSTVSLDRGTGGDGWADLSFRTVQISGIELNTGDVIALHGVTEGGDFDAARIDSLAFRAMPLDAGASNALSLSTPQADLTGADAVTENGMAEFDVTLMGLEAGQTPRLTLTGLPADTIVLNGEMSAISDGGPLDLEGWDLTDLDIAPPAGCTGLIEAQLSAQAGEGAPIATLDLSIEVAPADEIAAADPVAVDPVAADGAMADPVADPGVGDTFDTSPSTGY
ncbi:MAG: cadherin-like domain-containing protein, partial [Pseudomonadota bacterium]|nr:cadherin-like domain-containing protein [Pseudomonadota bacterium]